jgi:hypothetical protein
MGVNRELDASLAKQVVSPSADFREFVGSYFLDQLVYIRRECDPAVLDRLEGVERDTAVAMILANLRTGWHHIIDAAAHLRLTQAIDVLRSMWQISEYDDWDHFVMARALRTLGAMTDDETFAFLQGMLEQCDEIPMFEVLPYCYETFAPHKAELLIDIALRCDDFGVRAGAFSAAAAVQYIRTHGNRWTPGIAQHIEELRLASVTRGFAPPMWYEQANYYVGDAVYADKALFEQRLAELWEPDPSKRRVPLFTER